MARRATLLAAALAAALVGADARPASALDCGYGGCIADIERLPAGTGVDVADIIRRAQKFYGVDTKAWIVDSGKVKAFLPYYARLQPPIITKGQIHIPELYYWGTEFTNKGQRHYVWHYILGHEMAHAYQDNLKLVDAMTRMYANGSVVMVELHADFLAGFFLASEFGLSTTAIDHLLREMKALPSGAPGDASYHGEPGERFFMATQGALMAYQQPRPTLASASARGVRCAFDILTARDQARSLSELCK